MDPLDMNRLQDDTSLEKRYKNQSSDWFALIVSHHFAYDGIEKEFNVVSDFSELIFKLAEHPRGAIASKIILDKIIDKRNLNN